MTFKGRNERCCAAIAELYPKQPDFCMRAAGKIKKIVVFADDDPLLSLGVTANFNVQSGGQTDIKDVL